MRIKGRVLVEMLGQGFAEGRQNLSSAQLKEIYEHSLFFLFRLLFILNCEAKGILNVFNTSDYSAHSLRILCEELRKQLEEKRKWANQPQSYRRVLDLFRLLHSGAPEIGIAKGFADEAFSLPDNSFFVRNSVSDVHLNQVLAHLAYATDKKDSIDCKRLSADHFGSIFEGLLEFQPQVIDSKYVLLNDNGERKSSGSYYTPDYVVEFIIKETLEPLISGKTASEILNLRIIDPAIGSGRFLIGALNYLERAVLATDGAASLDPSEVRRLVLHNCLYGVDLNPTAVELSKFSLWMNTARTGQQIEPLEDQLKCMDGIDSDLPATFGIDHKFDAVIGNPPYVSELRGNKEMFRKYKLSSFTKDYYESKMDLFYFFIERGLDMLASGGRLGMIIEQYWLTRSNVKKLHDKIRSSSAIELMVDFGKNHVFESAPGVHSSILILVKDGKGIKGLQKVSHKKLGSSDDIEHWLNGSKTKDKLTLEFNRELNRYVRISEDEGSDVVSIPSGMIQQGIVGPQLSLRKSHLELLDKSAKSGDGVQLLTEQEVKLKKLNKDEMTKLRPFVFAREIKRFSLQPSERRYLIYLTKADSDKMVAKNCWPNIRRHLDGFKSILTSSNLPYGLHRPRQESWFEKGSKIFSVRKTKRPCFAWTSDEAYVDQSVLIIRSGNEFLDKMLTLVLNSDRAHKFFAATKTQGEQLQVDKEVILRLGFPGWIKFDSFSEESFRKSNLKLAAEIDKFFGILEKPLNEDVPKTLAEALWSLGSSQFFKL